PPREDLGHPLLETMTTLGPELASLAAAHLAQMRDGRGMVFLMEALTHPDLRISAQLVELLDFKLLGTGWVRLARVLETVPARCRRRLFERMLEDPYVIPQRRWPAVCLHAESADDLEI